MVGIIAARSVPGAMPTTGWLGETGQRYAVWLVKSLGRRAGSAKSVSRKMGA
jgi:hypothetical protein